MGVPSENMSDNQDNQQLTSKYEQEKAVGLRRSDGSLNLRQMKPIHYRMVELHMEGYKNSEIARMLTKTPATITRWLSDPLVVGYLEKLYKAEDARFKALQSKVVDVVEDALDMKKHDIGTNLKAADKWLKVNGKFGQDKGSDGQTAEDIIQQVFGQLNIQGDNVQVNLGRSPEEGEKK